jgi:hydroxymethylglutaryl-CoA reductase (NADPH)
MARTHGRLAMRQQWTEQARAERLEMLRLATKATLVRLSQPVEQPEQYRGQIENLIGVIGVPLGIAGPLAVNGQSASGVFYVPLATTEGTLVLAVTRGAEVMTAAGGATVHASDAQVTRAPLFVFPSGETARSAAQWVVENYASLRSEAESTTRHGRLLWIEPIVLGRRLVLEFTYQTGDASGQNMVTFATDAVCNWLRQRPPFDDLEFFTIESNISHDKKAANLTHAHRRGRRVNADITIPREQVLHGFRTDPERMARVTREGTYGCVVSGVVGAQAQFANVLGALFVATGQDVATVAECGTGLTIVEVTDGGDLHASITIPNLMVGTVGGGTRLASQHECLDLMGCSGAGFARKLAEIAGAAVLAGELALVASLASNTFAQAHAAFGRPPKPGQQR